MHRNHFDSSRGWEKVQFFKHFQTFLVFNGLFVFFSLESGRDLDWLPITFFWGLGLCIHYLKVFHSEDAGAARRRRERYLLEGEQEQREEEEQMELVELKKPARLWKDDDLV